MAGQGSPVYIINPNTEHKQGKDALSMNIAASKAVANIVKTTLGPKGMDKMLVNEIGDIVVTNDGAMILKGMDIEHPTAKMIVEVAKTQEDIAGDGTTSAVVIAGALLEKAEDLIEEGVHPTILVKGFSLAAEKSVDILDDFAVDVGENRDMLETVAKTSISGKGNEAHRDLIAKICVDAALEIAQDGKMNISDNIILRQDPSETVSDTEIVEGLMMFKSRLHPSMPKLVKDAKVALLDIPLEVRKTANKSKIQIETPEELEAYLAQEDADVKAIVDKIIVAGATAVFNTKNIDDHAVHYLQKAGIFAIRRVNDDDMKNLSYATGARIMKRPQEIEASDLGEAGRVEQEGDTDPATIFVSECPNAKVITMRIRGSTAHVTDDLERTIDDALRVVKAVYEDEKIVAGGGASEMEVAQKLREYASSIGGREQLAIAAFADAVETVPRAIADNAGFEGMDIILKLHAAHLENANSGFDVYSGDVKDMAEAGIVDPLRVKTQAILSASEVATMVLRVDDMMRAQRKSMMDVRPEHNIHNYNMPY
ncbi:thermosome [Methanohalophilus levihalophilus]|uniref:thermosome subunit alpha n=1 Tax=Methanohalophilus levihalophilus TaxID=1431282 RepID=UPI001AE2F9A3|nr:thermosome subunit alpha [Methanohalophilus levihalophilus]MBP2029167.1 thermosome [Methanohalophilus levihalophilus]